MPVPWLAHREHHAAVSRCCTVDTNPWFYFFFPTGPAVAAGGAVPTAFAAVFPAVPHGQHKQNCQDGENQEICGAHTSSTAM
ncbi:hypothetical protein [Butyricicoccus porcorum]|uniref:hypothetical protein n=1 Tax=Butyricicoccus porcorum TaxID=1945634 RepID=UPI003F4AB12E